MYKIVFIPLTFELSSLTGDNAEPVPKLAASLYESATEMKSEEARERMKILSKQFGNLSTPQAHRLYALANVFHELITTAVLFLAVGDNEASWESVVRGRPRRKAAEPGGKSLLRCDRRLAPGMEQVASDRTPAGVPQQGDAPLSEVRRRRRRVQPPPAARRQHPLEELGRELKFAEALGDAAEKPKKASKIYVNRPYP
jgi:hypothetical protein